MAPTELYALTCSPRDEPAAVGRVCSYLVRIGFNAASRSRRTATETELRNYARDHLAHFKCPQKIQFVPELPKTATGKVQKYVLRGKQSAISKQ